jgi:hypothetical protein
LRRVGAQLGTRPTKAATGTRIEPGDGPAIRYRQVVIPSALDGVRVVRLAAFGSAATVIALAAHLMAGGAPVGPSGTALAVLVSTAAGWALTRPRRRGTRSELIGSLGAVQLVLHELFAATGSAHSAACGIPMPGSMVMPGSMAMPGSMEMPPGLASGGPGEAWMLLAHAVAVALTGGLLAHGDHLWDLLRCWLRALPGPIQDRRRIVIRSAPRRPAVGHRPVRRLLSLRAATAIVRRGPPLRFC